MFRLSGGGGRCWHSSTSRMNRPRATASVSSFTASEAIRPPWVKKPTRSPALCFTLLNPVPPGAVRP